MNRDALNSALEILAPAFKAGKDDPPIYACACFDGEHVHSFNDVIAVRMKFPFPVSGGYNGGVLGRWVQSVKGKEIEAVREGNGVTFKSGRSKLSMSPMPVDAFAFEVPEAKNEVPVELDLEELLKATENVGACANRETPSSWQYGVTVHLSPKRKVADLYATSNIAIAHAAIGYAGKLSADYVVPADFFDLVAKHKASLRGLVATKQSMIADFEEVRVYSKLNLNVKVDNYQRHASAPLAAVKDKLLPMPKGMQHAVDRVLNILNKEDKLNLTCVGGNLTLAGEAKDGSARAKDTLKFPDHPECSVAIGYAKDFFKPLVPRAKSMCVLLEHKCLAMQAEGATFLVSLVQREDQKNQTEED